MNIGQLLTDLFVVTFLGLFIAFSPMLIIVNLLIVLKSRKPILHAVALMLGIVTPLLLVAGLGLLFINPNSQISISAISAKISIPPLIDVLFGLSLFGLAIKQYLKPSPKASSEKATSTAEFHIPNDNFMALYFFGFMKSLLSATNLFAILVVVKLIITSSLNPMFDALILVWTIAVGLIPFAIVLLYHRNRKDYLLRVNKRLNEIMARSLRRLIIIGLFSAASLFTLMGIWEFLHK